MKPNIPMIYDTEVNDDSQRDSKRLRLDPTNLTYLWHRLSQINLNMTKRLVKNGSLQTLSVGTFSTCESRREGKMTKRLFSAKGQKATK